MKSFMLALTALMLIMAVVGCSSARNQQAAQAPEEEADHIMLSYFVFPATQPADIADTGNEYQPGGGFFPSALAIRNAEVAAQQAVSRNVRKRDRYSASVGGSASVGYTRSVGGSGHAGRNGYAGRGR